jgi:hypothetical protein
MPQNESPDSRVFIAHCWQNLPSLKKLLRFAMVETADWSDGRDSICEEKAREEVFNDVCDEEEPIPTFKVPARSMGAMMPNDRQEPDPPPEELFDNLGQI